MFLANNKDQRLNEQRLNEILKENLEKDKKIYDIQKEYEDKNKRFNDI